MPARRRSSSSDDTTDEGGSSPARSRARGGAGRRVLIAGCGYVGVRLASRLAREGASVFALRRGRGPLPVGVEPVVADLARIETLGSLPPRIDAVVYTAAPGTSDEAAYRSIYLDGVDNLLRAIAERGERPPRFVFASSTAVYGQDRGECSDEDARVFGARRGLCFAQPARGADQQGAGEAAADRRLRQRHIRRGETHPDQRQQQPVGHEANHRREGVAHGDNPPGHC